MALSRIARTLGMKGWDKWGSFKYLGLPISSIVYKENHWQDFENEIIANISDWGGQWLNQAGKIVLIKYVPTSLLVY